MSPSEATLAWMRGRADTLLTNTAQSGNRIGTWLLLGNATAIVLIMKAVSEGSECALKVSYQSKMFLFGVLFAFLGWCLNYITSSISCYFNEKNVASFSVIVSSYSYIDEAKKENGTDYDCSIFEKTIEEESAKVSINQSRLKITFILALLAILSFIFSAVFFGIGSIQITSATTLKYCSL